MTHIPSEAEIEPIIRGLSDRWSGRLDGGYARGVATWIAQNYIPRSEVEGVQRCRGGGRIRGRALSTGEEILLSCHGCPACGNKAEPKGEPITHAEAWERALRQQHEVEDRLNTERRAEQKMTLPPVDYDAKVSLPTSDGGALGNTTARAPDTIGPDSDYARGYREGRAIARDYGEIPVRLHPETMRAFMAAIVSTHPQACGMAESDVEHADKILAELAKPKP